MKLCRHSVIADGSDRISGKAPSRYRHGYNVSRFSELLSCWAGAGTESRGHTCRWRFSPIGNGRKYNRLPLDEETRNTLLTGKGTSSFSCPPARAGLGRAQKKSLGRGMPERRGCPFQRASPRADSLLPLSSGSFCSNVARHHAPNKASQLPCHCRYSCVSLFSFV